MPSPTALGILATGDHAAVARYLSQQSPTDVLDYVDAAAASNTALLAATATTVAPQTILGSGLISVGGTAELAKCPRQLTFTTGGTTAQAPATAVITGNTAAGRVSETITPANTAATVTTVNAFTSIEQIAYGPAGGAAATISIGFNAVLGLPSKCRSRGAGIFPIVQEFKDGAAAANAGSIAGPAVVKPYGGYTAVTVVPNGAVDFLVRYDCDPQIGFSG